MPYDMNPEERLWLLSAACDVFLRAPEDEDFLVVQSQTLNCNYALLRFLDGSFRIELCSREWGCIACGDRPISPTSSAVLGSMGFVIPGPRENPERWLLNSDPRIVAIDLEKALLAAYGESPSVEIAIYLGRLEAMQLLMATLANPTPVEL